MAFQEVRESDDGAHISFKIKNVPMSVANGIRRSCLVEVPMAGIDIDTVSFDPDKNGVNTSSMHDEMLIHRLAYALLDLDPKVAGEYSFHICDPQDKDIPFENGTQGIIDFTTSDIRVFRNGTDTRIPSEDVFLGDSLLTRLKPGQKLRATFSATCRSVRQGNEVRYSFQPCKVKFSHTEATETAAAPRSFALEVTTHGFRHIKAREIVSRAIDVLRNKVEWLKTSDLDVEPDSVLPDCSIITVRGEDHTLGRMVVETLEQIEGVTFVAYMKTHALDSDMRLKVATGHDGKHTLLEACEVLSTLLDDIAQQWVAV